jgi:hypothetical protein
VHVGELQRVEQRERVSGQARDREIALQRGAASDAAVVVEHELEVALERREKRLAPVQAVGAHALHEQQRRAFAATLVVQLRCVDADLRHGLHASWRAADAVLPASLPIR